MERGNDEASAKGWLEDIRGRANAADIAEVRERTSELARHLALAGAGFSDARFMDRGLVAWPYEAAEAEA